jgi:hypothetical protein
VIAALAIAATLAGAPRVHHPVTTRSAQAQALFDRGLTLLYAYSGEGAKRAFAGALQADPHLAMADWGEALANGTDINTPLTPLRFAVAQLAAQRAQTLESAASPQERLYIDAVAARYAGTYDDAQADEDRYRALMAQLVQAYPDDDDAALLDAEALLEHSGVEHPDPQAVAIIDRILNRDPGNLFANHLCMHAYDYAADRTTALACADRMAAWSASFDPLEEHLAHMPVHTYIETGDYAKAVVAAERAWRLREAWDAQPNRPFELPYAKHDAYTGWTAAMMLSDAGNAEAWAVRVGHAYGGSDLWATWARYGFWQRIATSPATGEFYAPLARGLTGVHLGNPADARSMLALYANVDADYRWLLEAAIDEHDGNIAAAVAALNRAIADQRRDDGAEQLPVFPAGEMLGALYLRQHDPAGAERAFTQTLQRYPHDPRALYGLALAQKALGEAVSSAQTLKDFTTVWMHATPPNIADL